MPYTPMAPTIIIVQKLNNISNQLESGKNENNTTSIKIINIIHETIFKCFFLLLIKIELALSKNDDGIKIM